MPADTAQNAWVARVLGVSIGAGALAGAVGPGAARVDGAAVKKRLADIETAYLQAVGRDSPDRTRLTAMMAMATEFVEDGSIDRAGATLDRLEKLLAQPGAEDPKPTLPISETPLYDIIGGKGQLVAYRKALLAWDAAKKQAHGQIGDLKKKIAGAAPALEKSADILDRVMDRLDEDLSDAIDAAISAEDIGLRARANARAAEIARSYLMTVNFDKVFAKVDGNPVMPLTLRTTLSGALTQVVAAMPA